MTGRPVKEWIGKTASSATCAVHKCSKRARSKNNNISNLVPSCHSCNFTRGVFVHWVLKHRDDPFLLSLFSGALRSDAA